MATLHLSPPPISSQAMADLLCTLVMLCTGKDRNGKHFWAYMCIKPSMAEAFQKARESGKFNLMDFGTVLEAGEGDDAPLEVKQRMERDYGVRHDYEDKMLKIISDIKKRMTA